MSRILLEQAFEAWYQAHVNLKFQDSLLVRVARLTQRAADRPCAAGAFRAWRWASWQSKVISQRWARKQRALLSRSLAAWYRSFDVAKVSRARLRRQVALMECHARRVCETFFNSWLMHMLARKRSRVTSQIVSSSRTRRLRSQSISGWALISSQSKRHELSLHRDQLAEELCQWRHAEQQRDFKHALSHIAHRPIAEMENLLASKVAEVHAIRCELDGKAAEAEASSAAHAQCLETISGLETEVRLMPYGGFCRRSCSIDAGNQNWNGIVLLLL